MRQSDLGVMIGLVGIVAVGGCSVIERPAPAVQTQDWTSPAGQTGVQMITDHFDLRVTARDPMLREYLPTFMEATFAAYERVLPRPGVVSERAYRSDEAGTGASTTRTVAETASTQSSDHAAANSGISHSPGDTRLIVYLFDTRDQWALFTRGMFPDRADTYLHIHAGGYTDYPTATAVAFDLQRERTLSLLAHEGMHQYMARFLPEHTPAWINEGLATQWESFELAGPVPTFTPRRNYQRLSALREVLATRDAAIPLARLLAMDAGQALTSRAQPTRAFYAQVWALVLFLREGPCPMEYREGFSRLLLDLGTPRMRAAIRAERVTTPGAEAMSDGEILFRHYITDDLNRAQDEYRRFNEALVR